MSKKYGSSRGVELTEELIRRLAEEAEAGYDVERLRSRSRGRPPLGSEASSAFQFRLEPELRNALARQAAESGTTPSELARAAVRRYVKQRDEAGPGDAEAAVALAPSTDLGPLVPPTRAEGDKWDVFISYAGEDRSEVAEPLSNALRRAGLAVWYSEAELRIGDSLLRKIDEGLARSRYGVVILSPSFFAKKWPRAELDGLTAKEVEGEKVILPIWHRLTANELLEFSPTLAGRFAIEWERGVDAVVEQITHIVAVDAASRHVAEPLALGSGSPDAISQALQPDDYFVAATQWLAQSRPASIEVACDQVSRWLVESMRAADFDESLRLLDSLCAIAAAVVAYGRDSESSAVRRVPDVYNAVLRQRRQLRINEVRLALELLNRINGLGGLAVRRKNWRAVYELAGQPVTGEQDPEVKYVLRHAQLQWARSQRNSRLSTLHFAHDVVAPRRWLRPDTLAEDEILLESLCQFDLVAGLILLRDAPSGEREAGGLFWPEFARFPNRYSEPVLGDILPNSAAKHFLGFDEDRGLATAMQRLDGLARHESFAPYGGWRGYSTDLAQQFLRQLRLEPPGLL